MKSASIWMRCLSRSRDNRKQKPGPLIMGPGLVLFRPSVHPGICSLLETQIQVAKCCAYVVGVEGLEYVTYQLDD